MTVSLKDGSLKFVRLSLKKAPINKTQLFPLGKCNALKNGKVLKFKELNVSTAKKMRPANKISKA